MKLPQCALARATAVHREAAITTKPDQKISKIWSSFAKLRHIGGERVKEVVRPFSRIRIEHCFADERECVLATRNEEVAVVVAVERFEIGCEVGAMVVQVGYSMADGLLEERHIAGAVIQARVWSWRS